MNPRSWSNSSGEVVYVVGNGRLISAIEEQARVWSAGDVVGEIACLDGGPQIDTVRCETKALLLAVACETFEKMMLNYPIIGLNLGSIYRAWLRNAHQQLTCMSDHAVQEETEW